MTKFFTILYHSLRSFSPLVLGLVSTRKLLFNFLRSAFFNIFAYEFAIEFIILTDGDKPNISSVSGIRNLPYRIILGSSAFENFILADETFVKALQNLRQVQFISLSVSDNFCEKVVLSLESPTTFDERF